MKDGNMNNRIKVIQLVSTLNDGGAETLVKDYVRFIDKSRFEVMVVCCLNPQKTANEKWLEENQIKVVKLWEKLTLPTRLLHKIAPTWFFGARCRRVLKDFRPDVIHSHLDVLKLLRFNHRQLKNTGLFFTCHTENDGTLMPNREVPAANFLIQHNGMRVIALHDTMRTELNRMFDINNTVVLHNGIDMERFTQTKKTQQDMRREIGIPEDAYLVGHVGRFSQRKNHSFLIEVYREVLRREPKAHLLLVGSGELERSIREKIDAAGLTEKVTILSHRTDIPELLKAMNVYLFPSLHEGLSIALLEAQACGLPCVVSDTIDAETFCSDGITKLPLDAPISEWAEAVIHPQSNVECAQDSREFDIRYVVKKLETLYTERVR